MGSGGLICSKDVQLSKQLGFCSKSGVLGYPDDNRLSIKSTMSFLDTLILNNKLEQVNDLLDQKIYKESIYKDLLKDYGVIIGDFLDDRSTYRNVYHRFIWKSLQDRYIHLCTHEGISLDFVKETGSVLANILNQELKEKHFVKIIEKLK